MLQRLERGEEEVLGRDVYGAAQAVRLLNFRRDDAPQRPPSRGRLWRGGCAATTTGPRASGSAPIRSGGPTTPTTTRSNSASATGSSCASSRPVAMRG